MRTRNELVREFHLAMGQSVRTTPTIPPDVEVRLGLRLLAEEFVETLRASLYAPKDLDALQVELNQLIDNAEIDVEMAELADGLEDVEYIIEGIRHRHGIDPEPIMLEVHRANMAKLTGPVRADGKRLKPIGWRAPDVEGCLARQGFRVIEGGKGSDQ